MISQFGYKIFTSYLVSLIRKQSNKKQNAFGDPMNSWQCLSKHHSYIVENICK